MARSALLNVMVNAVTKAGRPLARDFGEIENLQVSMKGPADFVVAADRKCGQALVAELTKGRPGYSFLTKDRGVLAGTDETHRWIVDPLAGSTNFLHGIPVFGVSLALEREGQIVAAVLFNPVTNDLYVCERGGGVFVNDRRMRVAGRTALADCVVGTSIPHLGTPDHAGAIRKMQNVMIEVAGLRASGAPAFDLASVAAGRLDGFWQEGLQPWDIAAGMLFVREAGGKTTDLWGGEKMIETKTVCAGNEKIQARLLTAVTTARA
ncbi:inositol monophosphatase family protein [Kaistia granuli]|uniref:inositol monophosphatase family protein n=1 Tax=Kaistia granuli TaxID=363259 RepID=UPI00035FFFAC|nr:inositol monophosphatase family protein [Kaistia granuli]